MYVCFRCTIATIIIKKYMFFLINLAKSQKYGIILLLTCKGDKSMTKKDIFMARLKGTMEAKDKTAADLERETGLNKSTLSRYLSGKCIPKLEALQALSKALGVNAKWLIGAQEENEDKDETIVRIFNSLSEDEKEKAMFYLKNLASKDE